LFKNPVQHVLRAEISTTCYLRDDEEKPKKERRPPITDPNFEGRIGYQVRDVSVEESIEYMKSDCEYKLLPTFLYLIFLVEFISECCWHFQFHALNLFKE